MIHSIIHSFNNPFLFCIVIKIIQFHITSLHFTQIYLSGEYDTLPKPNDRCGNAIQGESRHERAINFFNALQEYHFEHAAGRPAGLVVHEFHTIPNSNHDHALMFQSPLGRDAIFGTNTSQFAATIGY